MSTTTFNTTSCICYRYLLLLSPHSRPTLSTDPRRLSTLPPTLSYPAFWYVYFSTLLAPLTSFFPLFFLCFSYVCLLFRLHFQVAFSGGWRLAFGVPVAFLGLLFWVCFSGVGVRRSGVLDFFAFPGCIFWGLAYGVPVVFGSAFLGGGVWRSGVFDFVVFFLSQESQIFELNGCPWYYTASR